METLQSIWTWVFETLSYPNRDSYFLIDHRSSRRPIPFSTMAMAASDDHCRAERKAETRYFKCIERIPFSY